MLGPGRRLTDGSSFSALAALTSRQVSAGEDADRQEVQGAGYDERGMKAWVERVREASRPLR